MTSQTVIPKNIDPKKLPLYPWSTIEDKEASLQAFYTDVQKSYNEVINWYLIRKSGSRNWARILRFFIIILTTFSATGLLMTASNTDASWAKEVGLYSSIAFAFAGGLAAFDKYFGFSTSWIRSITTSLNLQKELNNFQIKMNTLSANCTDEQDNLNKKLEQIEKSYTYLYDQMIGEADQWAKEFQGNLSKSLSQLSTEIKNGK